MTNLAELGLSGALLYRGPRPWPVSPVKSSTGSAHRPPRRR
jgi:hypothetical protein